uniref:Uncharacterized protein n=1 Tax=Medicago truncatula TaxID=3880 RepID=A2Q4S4_MEDTR|nr:hypothetical protein MtrDRAFT_AC157777g29v2 [Medicago truncatula]
MVGWIDVHAQFNGGESQRLNIRYLGVTLRGLKDELTEFNQGVNPRDTRMVEDVWNKRPTLDEGRVSFTWVELTNDENVTSMFWEHSMFQWIDMRVKLLRSIEDIIKSLIPPKRSSLVRVTQLLELECTFQLQQLSYSGWGNSNLLIGRTPAFDEHLEQWYSSVKECTSFF